MHGFKPLIDSIMAVIMYDVLYTQYSKDQVREPRQGLLTCFVFWPMIITKEDVKDNC